MPFGIRLPSEYELTKAPTSAHVIMPHQDYTHHDFFNQAEDVKDCIQALRPLMELL